MSLHPFTNSLPLEEIGCHIATDFSVTRRSTIVVDSFIAPIDEDASCMEYTVSFCDEESSGIVCFKCLEEMLVVGETIMREFITSSCLLEELIKGIEISFISVFCIMRDKSRRDTAFLGESDIISSFFRKARKELLFVYSEVKYSCHRFNKATKRCLISREKRKEKREKRRIFFTVYCSQFTVYCFQWFNLQKEIIFITNFSLDILQEFLIYGFSIDSESIESCVCAHYTPPLEENLMRIAGTEDDISCLMSFP